MKVAYKKIKFLKQKVFCQYFGETVDLDNDACKHHIKTDDQQEEN